MGRPADWSPLTDADPVPGDPYEVAALGRRFRATAAEITAAAKRLRTMCTDQFWDSGAGTAFRDRSDATAGKLDKAHARYAAAATALGTDPGDAAPSTAVRPNYAGALAQAQRLSERALPPAQDAAHTQRVAMNQLDDLSVSKPLQTGQLTTDSSGHLPSAPLDNPEAAALKRHYNAAADQLATARALLDRATALRATAANNASNLISGVINSDGLGDSWWDHFTNFIDEHAGLLQAISQVAGWVATACGMLALVVGWIPFVGQALAAVLGTIALVASVVALIADVLLKIGGKGSWFDLAMDVIAVASFGLGRAAAGAVKDGALIARGAGRLVKFEAAIESVMSSDAWLKDGEEGVRDVFPEAWQAAAKAVGDPPAKQLEEALARGSARWPGWSRILSGFHPGAILEDWFKDIGELKLSNWKALFEGSAWKGARFFVGDPEIHEALQSLTRLADVADEPPVKSYLARVASNQNMWRYVTVPAVAADFTNHFIAETGLKDGLLHDVGLGWAAESG
jgi:hypothetical protein